MNKTAPHRHHHQNLWECAQFCIYVPTLTHSKFCMSSVIFVLVLILTLYVSNIGASSFADSAAFSVGSRSVLRTIGEDRAEKPDYAVELNATDFDAVLKATPATYAIVEFFAHWWVTLHCDDGWNVVKLSRNCSKMFQLEVQCD